MLFVSKIALFFANNATYNLLLIKTIIYSFATISDTATRTALPLMLMLVCKCVNYILLHLIFLQIFTFLISIFTQKIIHAAGLFRAQPR